MAIQSAFRANQFKPEIASRWEAVADADPNSATSQLIYELLVQVRMVKMILAWVLFAIPAIVGIAILVLTLVAESSAADSPVNPDDF